MVWWVLWHNRTLAKWLECLPMAWETWVQSQVKSHQRLRKWYLMPPCLTLSIVRYGSRVKWSNPGKGVAPSPTPWCISYRKGSLRVTHDYGRQLYLLTTFVGYLMPNPFLCKSVRFKTIQFSVSKVSVSKLVQFKRIQFSKSTLFKCEYSLISMYSLHLFTFTF